VERKRITIFLAITFAITWTASLACYVMGLYKSGTLYTAVFASLMFVPGISSLATRALTKEGFADMHLEPHFKGNANIYLLAWVMPTFLIAAGAAVYFLIFPRQFTADIGKSAFIDMIAFESAEPMAAFSLSLPAILALCAAALAVGPLVNFIPSLGEELGWRGYLLPKLLVFCGPVKSSVISGAVWGLWHAPMVAMGLKYGFHYPFAPFSGMAAMAVVCFFVGAIENYTYLRTKSVIPAVILHGAFNAVCEAPGLVVLAGANPLLGPKPIGCIGGFGFIVWGLICLGRMKGGSTEQPNASKR